MADNQSANFQSPGETTQSIHALATQAAEQAREMLESGATGDEILTMLVKAAEDVGGRGTAVCSILVLDKEGLLRNAASPNLPADYCRPLID